jgi:hypothetical protein
VSEYERSDRMEREPTVEREIARLERLAVEGEHRGPSVPGERELPSIRRA